MAVVATDAGLSSVDIASPIAPVLQAQVPLPGGAHGVALVPDNSFTDRAGHTHTGTFVPSPPAMLRAQDGSRCSM